MKVGIVFHKDPSGTPTGIDLVRLRAITRGLIARGIETEIVAPVSEVSVIDGNVKVMPLDVLLQDRRYTIVKTCYHQSIKLIGGFAGLVVSRIVRVVDQELPERDAPLREELLECQALISGRAQAVVFNNSLNEERWRQFYGSHQIAQIIPTGCPKQIPTGTENPFSGNKPVLLFLGSLAAPRMVKLLNRVAKELRRDCEIHVVGANKTGMYGAKPKAALNSSIFDHGELPEPEVWRYIEHSSVGLALATGPHAFDNDLSKMFNYLRGGLPILSEDTVYTNYLLKETSYGHIVPFDNSDAFIRGAKQLLNNPLPLPKDTVMEYMAIHHSWDNRVNALIHLFERILQL